MNALDQQIKIAELMGFTMDQYPGKKRGPIGWRKGGVYYPKIPDYLNDLNAMAEAEDTLDVIKMTQYVSILRNIAAVEGFWAESAKAKWRAKAFLGAHDLWKN